MKKTALIIIDYSQFITVWIILSFSKNILRKHIFFRLSSTMLSRIKTNTNLLFQELRDQKENEENAYSLHFSSNT